ncbi:MAG: hypothetical protein COA69_02810 [Robiginitomaculum sp.]|nr:MAG: hypothetical protein COA69_02810 [Robiginitomaculum sp.]
MPRGQCSFRRVDLKSTGRNAILAARLRAYKEVLPHEDKVRVVKDQTGLGAGVWSYGSTPTQRDPDAIGASLPESLARQPLDNGVRLVSCFEGVEGQVWAGRSLVASRWWSSDPSARQWQTFLRAAPLESELETLTGDMPQPKPEQVPFRSDLPLFEIDAERAVILFSPKKIALAGSFVGACIFLYLGTQYVRHTATLVGAARKMEHMSEATAQILSQRRRALANMSTARRSDVLGDVGRVLNGLDSLSQTLAGQGFVLRSVQVRDGEFEARIIGDTSLNGPGFVEKLEASVALQQVNVTPENNSVLHIRAQLQSVDLNGEDAPQGTSQP